MMDVTGLGFQVLDLMTPILLAAIAGALSERVGLFNVALEGMMLVGAFAAIAAASMLGSTPAGALVAVVATMGFALPMAVGTTWLKGNSVVIGIGLNLLAAGLTAYLLSTMFGVRGTYFPMGVASLASIDIPVIASIPYLGAILSGHDVLVYTSWICTVLLGVFLFRTPLGLRSRGIGENAAAAEAMGTNVNLYRAVTMLAGAALCGLAGAKLVLGSITLFSEGMTAGRGWIAVVAVMLGRAHPVGVVGACLLFGLADSIGLRLQGQGLPNQITDAAPYAITLFALIVVSMRQSRTRAI